MPGDRHPFEERCACSYELSNASICFLKPADVIFNERSWRELQFVLLTNTTQLSLA